MSVIVIHEVIEMVWQEVVDFDFDREKGKYILKLKNKQGKEYAVNTDFGSAGLIFYEWANYARYNKNRKLFAKIEWIADDFIEVLDVGWR